jgi:hypothetical protein
MTTVGPIRTPSTQAVVEALAELERTHTTLDLSLGIEQWMRSRGWQTRVRAARPDLYAEAEAIVRQIGQPPEVPTAPARPHLTLIKGEG